NPRSSAPPPAARRDEGGSVCRTPRLTNSYGSLLGACDYQSIFLRPTVDIDCHRPSSNTARPAASSIALQPIMTSVAVTPLLPPNGRTSSPFWAFAANVRTTLAKT